MVQLAPEQHQEVLGFPGKETTFKISVIIKNLKLGVLKTGSLT